MKKKVIVLGATGTIGRNTLSVIDSHSDEFTTDMITAHSRKEELAELAAQYNARTFTTDTETVLREIRESDADIVVNGIAGAAGLLPSFETARSGKRLALANKESIVMAGPLLLEEARRNGCEIIPVDSEHAALFELQKLVPPEQIDEIVITASGGAFRDLPFEELENVTPEQALNHPTWKMGPKITVDSATMANKGLEVIEAVYLFHRSPDLIRVLIHPQSRVHALIRTTEGSFFSQISAPDMRIPIQNALTYPGKSFGSCPDTDLTVADLSFRKPDLRKYPMLPLAYRAAAEGLSATITYNAVNEIAVDAFFRRQLSFFGIARLTEAVLDLPLPATPQTLTEVTAVDAAARSAARRLLENGFS